MNVITQRLTIGSITRTPRLAQMTVVGIITTYREISFRSVNPRAKPTREFPCVAQPLERPQRSSVRTVVLTNFKLQ